MSESYEDIINDKFESEYEEICQGADLFGIPREFAWKLAVLRELKELNRLFCNWSEGRKAW